MDLPPLPATIAPDALTTVLDGRWAALRRELRAAMAGTGAGSSGDATTEARAAVEATDTSEAFGTFAADSVAGGNGTTEQQRRQVLRDLRVLAATGHPHIGFPRSCGGRGDIGGSAVAFEMLGFGDLFVDGAGGCPVGAVRRRGSSPTAGWRRPAPRR